MIALIRHLFSFLDQGRFGYKSIMRRIILLIALIGIVTGSMLGQGNSGTKQLGTAPSSRSPADTAQDLAKATLAAHGGDKLKKVRTLVMKGSIDLNAFNQTMPGAFSTAISGDKYFFEIVSPMQTLKQVYNGQDTYSSIQGFSLPPVTSLGFPLLPRVGDEGYVIAALDSKKKQRGFRITTPEGFYTDFFVDDKTNQIKGYDSAYDVGGRIVTTSVEIKAYEVVDGVSVPKNYSQRFDLGAMTAYVSFKTKTIQINSQIEDAAFDLK
jgi:hypothetical protein